MSVLIKGMKMPKDREKIVFIFPDGVVHVVEKDTPVFEAVPVPPHGRLIDADAIPYKKIMFEDDDFYYGVTQPYIDRMPTVIPAEEGKT